MDQLSRSIEGLPKWADSRLIVRAAGYSEAPLVIDGNPHTFNGLVRLYDTVARRIISVRPNEITEATDDARAWLAGYIAGSEPSGPSAPELASLRRDRELAFYTRYQRELPAERRGQFVTAASREAWYGPIEDVQSAIARLIVRLGSLYPAWRGGWLPSNRTGVNILRLDSTADVVRLFRLLNPGADLGYESVGWPQIAVFNADASDSGFQAGAIELSFDGYLVNDEVAEYRLIVNLERPDLMVDTSGRIGQPERVLEDILGTVIDYFDVDLASVSTGTALLHAEEVNFAPAEDADDLRNGSSIVPGWRTYVSSRLLNSPECPPSDALRVHRRSNGVLVSAKNPIGDFSLEDSQRVGRFLESIQAAVGGS